MTNISSVLSELPTLTSSRLRIRWLTSEDIPQLYAIFSDPEVTRYWSQPPMPDEVAAAQLLDSVEEFFRAGTLYQWGVELRESPGIIGTCTLASIDLQNQRAEVGYALHRSMWGRGLITETLVLLLKFAFDTLGLNRIEADVDPRNARSIHVLERLGFQREGFMRERWIVNGLVQDTTFFGLLRREWTGGPAGQAPTKSPPADTAGDSR